LAFTPPVPAFSFDDLEKLEKEEQADLLQKARNAANSENFGSVRSYLDQARNKGFAPKQVNAVASLISSQEAAKAERDRRAEEVRRQEDARRLAEAEAARRRAQSSGSSGSYGVSVDGTSNSYSKTRLSSHASPWRCEFLCGKSANVVTLDAMDKNDAENRAHQYGKQNCWSLSRQLFEPMWGRLAACTKQ